MPRYISQSDAKTFLHRADRILVVGSSGGGKTTLALAISQAHGHEYQSLDRDARWLPGWKKRDRHEQRAIISELASRNRWVMDGSGASTFDLRIPRADLIVWMRPPRLKAMLSVARRVYSNYGKVRIAMPDGCPEPLPNREFLSFIWHFERDSAPRFVEQFDRYGPQVPVVVIPSHKEGTQLLS